MSLSGLQRQNLTVPLTGGLAENITPTLAPAGRLLVAENGWIAKDGSIQQRPGSTALATTVYPGGEPLPAGHRIYSHEGELLVSDGRWLYAWYPNSGKWLRKDRVPEATIAAVQPGERGQHMTGSSSQVVWIDSDVYALAWYRSGSVYVRFVDATTGATHGEFTVEQAAPEFRLLAIGGTILLFTLWDKVITCHRHSYADPFAGWTSHVVGLDSSGHWDAAVLRGWGTILLAFHSTATGKIEVRAFSVSFVQSASTSIVGTPANSLTLAGRYTGQVQVVWDDDAQGLLGVGLAAADLSVIWPTAVLDANVLDLGASRVRRVGLALADDDSSLVLYDLTGGDECRQVALDQFGNVKARGAVHHTQLYSVPIYREGQYYAILYQHRALTDTFVDGATEVDITVYQRHGWLCSFAEYPPAQGETNKIETRVVVRLADYRIGTQELSLPTNLWPAGADEYVAAIQVIGSTRSDANEGFDVYRLRFGDVDAGHPEDCQGDLLLSGGVPSCYDGEHVFEVGFHYAPFPTGTATYAIDGQLTQDAWYSWVAVYSYQDARGVRHVSAPSVPVRAEIKADSPSRTVLTKWAALTLTEKEDAERATPVQLEVYRTLANGSVYYLDGTHTNYKDTPELSHTSTAADTALRQKPKLYTDGGVLANDTPPASRQILRHGPRLWSVSAEDPTQVWASKTDWQAGEFPGFSLGLIVKSRTELTALASLDSNLLLLGTDAMQLLVGDGPNDLGGQTDLRGPLHTSVRAGCVSPRSLALTPYGLVARGARGIDLVDRSVATQTISGPVEAALEANPQVASTVYDPALGLTFVACRTAGESLAPTLVLHAGGEWTRWRIPGAADWADACLHDGALHLLSTDGHVCRLDTTTLADWDGQMAPFTVSSPWVQVAGLQGYQSVRRVALLGRHQGAHAATVRLYNDLDDSAPVATYPLTAAEVAAFTEGSREQLSIHVGAQKCEAIRVEVEVYPEIPADPEAPWPTASVRWEALTLEVGIKGGIHRLPYEARR